MSLERVLEPEVMDSDAEAISYDAMDHSEVNERFVADLIQWLPVGEQLSPALDLGTGTARIPMEWCKTVPNAKVIATDLAASMLELASTNIAAAGFRDRIELCQCDAKSLPFQDDQFPLVFSNSIIHHIPDPVAALREIARVAGRWIFVRDLMRPATNADVIRLVAMYAGNESDHAKQMFDDSLRAALSLEEIRQWVAGIGFDPASVRATTDRHWTWATKVAPATGS